MLVGVVVVVAVVVAMAEGKEEPFRLLPLFLPFLLPVMSGRFKMKINSGNLLGIEIKLCESGEKQQSKKEKLKS